jgi:hypothetical protein
LGPHLTVYPIDIISNKMGMCKGLFSLSYWILVWIKNMHVENKLLDIGMDKKYARAEQKSLRRGCAHSLTL